MRVVLQLPGHFLLLSLRTAAPHGSTPSLTRSSGTATRGQVTGKLNSSCRQDYLAARRLRTRPVSCDGVSMATDAITARVWPPSADPIRSTAPPWVTGFA